MLHGVARCSIRFPCVLKCSKMFHGVPRVLQGVAECSKVFQGVPGCSRVLGRGQILTLGLSYPNLKHPSNSISKMGAKVPFRKKIS